MDTEGLRALAGNVRALGARLHEEAEGLRSRADAVAWDGVAADAMRLRAAERVAALRGAGTLAGVAAAALDRHADEVERRGALLPAALGLAGFLA